MDAEKCKRCGSSLDNGHLVTFQGKSGPGANPCSECGCLHWTEWWSPNPREIVLYHPERGIVLDDGVPLFEEKGHLVLKDNNGTIVKVIE